MSARTTDLAMNGLLRLMAANYNHRKKLNTYLRGNGGWIDFSVGFRTEDSGVEEAIIFKGGRVKVARKIPADCDVRMVFRGEEVLKEMVKLPPGEVFNLLLKNRVRVEGNMTYLNLFNLYISLVLGGFHRRMIEKQKAEAAAMRRLEAPSPDPAISAEIKNRRHQRMKAGSIDPGVKHLAEPYLSEYSLEDFPRLERFLEIHFNVKPEVCAERAKLMCDWFLENGFEIDDEGKPWVPELRQAGAFKYMMENRKPIIRADELIAGTTTSREIGVLGYPDAAGTMFWGELGSSPFRMLNSYDVSTETADVLHHHVFPFWAKRNVREWVRKEHGNPLGQQLDERFAVIFMFKTSAFSHTIADLGKVLRVGTSGIIREIAEEIAADTSAGTEKKDTLEAMRLCLEGINAYAAKLSAEASRKAGQEPDPIRKAELERLAAICASVPEYPSATLQEALNAIWITFVGLHNENTNAGLSLGRLDQLLQPFFEADISKMATAEEREEYIGNAIELVGAFFMKCTDHLPLFPDVANYLFGGSSSDQAITLGGVTPGGEDGVNDMTYIFLKVTEILNIRDPNMNAKYNPGKNSETYLKRLCEVNRITAATPSMHNDAVVMESLEEFDYPVEELRDWAAVGCVEPTIWGRHMGHTNFQMMNMVAALEMAMNNGRHPLMDWEVGPKTGSIEAGDFPAFEEFYEAFTTQFKFLIDASVDYNNMLGEAHAYIRPTPLLSSLIDDSIKKGKDVTQGGARYNTSGAACIGLADVTDSLMAIKKLVYDEKKVTFSELKRAVDTNFENDPALHAMVTSRVPFFGSGSEEAVAMATRVSKFAHDSYISHRNYRGGPYTTGFWTMSNHVAFGTLTGALPSGRLAWKAFTPGLTPEPNAGKDLLDNIRDVAKLDPRNMNNNMAFNVKVVPGASDSHDQVVERMYSYVKTYFDLGGMQMQMNVVTSDTLRDAMAHPESYRNLLVRISGYNAYFVTLNHDLQVELVERAEYGI